ncbi:MAG: branched-chain amino acid transport system ATP-binding protein livF, partial [Actinomycetota bacterium]|nr:branched-chain amino acid transport system ATP-binding protein livF [Actinomycetota bacterium]
QGFLTLVALTQLGGLLLAVPLAYYSDRLQRVVIAVVGAAVWGVFGIVTGLSVTVLMLVIARSGSGMGRAVITPTHNSLMSDYYPPEVRADVFGFHSIGLALGALFGPVLGGLLAHYWGWRLPFFLFTIPTFVFVILGLRLREPGRGHYERAAAGASEAVIGTDEIPPSFAESVRILWQVGTLRRIWYSLPFLAASFIGLTFLTSLYYEQVFNLGDFQRGVVAAVAEPAQIVAILLGIPLAARLMLRDPGLGMRLLAVLGTVIAGCWIVFALAPNLGVAIAMNIAVSGLSSLLVPGIYASLSLTIPPKVRSLGFAMAALFIVPGLLALYIVGGIADAYGIRAGLLIVAPIFLIGAWILSSGSFYVRSDINRVWTSTAAQAEVMFKRQQGEVKLLLVRNVDVHYGGVQVLFGVNFEVDEGEIVALLGTNGAGKSTLLKAISGLVEATNGAIVFDGRDMTYAPPNETAARGVVQMPGGQGTFPTLSVAEHLRLAGWLHRKDRERVAADTARVLELFPVLRDRMGEPAGNLSGGQQQMLALGMAFIQKPRLLMIDELSLGLAPTIVEQLLPLVRDIAAQGTTVILVEQSVNLALTIAQTAYFMEKGEIRFHGPTAELLERPDVLRSVFLEGAKARSGASETEGPAESEPLTSVPATAARVEPPSTNGHEREADEPGELAIRLTLDDVTKRFGGLTALSSVSFSATGGEIVGFIGPNGAGKTTLFDTISGFTLADSGTIVAGEGDDAVDITRLPPAVRARLGLGRSFQDGRLFPSLTVAETVALAFERHLEVRDPIGAALHLPFVAEAEANVTERVEELLELLGITDFRDKLGRELSTGSRRIVDLACVLAHSPSVLLLDEPSSGIAQREAEALGPLLLRIREQTGATMLVIEHDVPLLLSVADRLIALELGEIVAAGNPDDVVRDPNVVRSYLGTTGAAIARSGALGPD